MNANGRFRCERSSDNRRTSSRIHRHRRIIDPEILEQGSEEEEEEDQERDEEHDDSERMDTSDKVVSTRVKMDIESSDDDEEPDEEAIERRRQRLRLKAKEREEVRTDS
jgi:hypothetical protein